MARSRLGRGVRGARAARGARRPGPGAGREPLPLGRLPPRPAREPPAHDLRPGRVGGRRGRSSSRPSWTRPWPPRDSPRAATRAIRRFRDREIFRADLRSILGLSRDRRLFSAELSDVAEVLLRAAYATRPSSETRARAARSRADELPPSALFALGKFGGRELGFASDLELHARLRRPADRLRAPRPTAAGGFFDGVVAALRACPRQPARAMPSTSISGSAPTAAPALRPRRSRRSSTITAAGGPAWGYERQALIKLRVDRRRPGAGARGRGTPRPVRLRSRAVRPGGLPSDAPAPGRAARPARHDQRQVQPGCAGRRRILRPGAADRHGSRDPRCGRRTPCGPSLPSAARLAPGSGQVVTLRGRATASSAR